jgi:hypothetical protein
MGTNLLSKGWTVSGASDQRRVVRALSTGDGLNVPFRASGYQTIAVSLWSSLALDVSCERSLFFEGDFPHANVPLLVSLTISTIKRNCSLDT